MHINEIPSQFSKVKTVRKVKETGRKKIDRSRMSLTPKQIKEENEEV